MYEEIDQAVIEALTEVGAEFLVSRTNSQGYVENLVFTGLQVNQIIEEMPNSGIQIGDWRLLFTSKIKPLKGDRLTLNSGVHTIMRVEEIAPAKIVLGYWVWGRLG